MIKRQQRIKTSDHKQVHWSFINLMLLLMAVGMILQIVGGK